MPLFLNILKKYPNSHFVETGTCTGEGVRVARVAGFSNIHSIECFTPLYKKAVRNFSKDKRIQIIKGNSGKDLGRIIRNIKRPITFWLDAHYSGEGTAFVNTYTPILQELEQISRHPIKNHTILIDDMRLFGKKATQKKGTFPHIEPSELEERIKLINPHYTFKRENGFIPNDILVAIVPSPSKTLEKKSPQKPQKSQKKKPQKSQKKKPQKSQNPPKKTRKG